MHIAIAICIRPTSTTTTTPTIINLSCPTLPIDKTQNMQHKTSGCLHIRNRQVKEQAVVHQRTGAFLTVGFLVGPPELIDIAFQFRPRGHARELVAQHR